MRMLLYCCSLLLCFSSFQTIGLENEEGDSVRSGINNEDDEADAENNANATNNANFQQMNVGRQGYTNQNEMSNIRPIGQGDDSSEQQNNTIDTEDEPNSVTVDKSDKRQVQNYVQELLSGAKPVSPEVVGEEKILEHTQNLEKNIEALRTELHDYSEAKKSENSKIKRLHSMINSAFTDYFGGEVPSDDKLKAATDEKDNKKT